MSISLRAAASDVTVSNVASCTLGCHCSIGPQRCGYACNRSHRQHLGWPTPAATRSGRPTDAAGRAAAFTEVRCPPNPRATGATSVSADTPAHPCPAATNPTCAGARPADQHIAGRRRSDGRLAGARLQAFRRGNRRRRPLLRRTAGRDSRRHRSQRRGQDDFHSADDRRAQARRRCSCECSTKIPGTSTDAPASGSATCPSCSFSIRTSRRAKTSISWPRSSECHRGEGGSASTRSSSWSISKRPEIAARPRCLAACSAGSSWPVRSCINRAC